MNPRFSSLSTPLLSLGLLLGLGAGIPAQAQTGPVALNTYAAAGSTKEKNALERGRYAVLIDLDENRLYFKQGEITLWSAPVGTGKGLRVVTEDDDWLFNTPTGRFQVQYKERDPVWIAPDWFFVNNNLPVPPTNDPKRYMRGTLGAAAIYFSPDLAIHGTDRPDLIGQRVSHGCIRLENRYALRLYHAVQTGTEIIIVGGETIRDSTRTVDLRRGYDPSIGTMGPRPPAARADRTSEEWRRLQTAELLEILDHELDEGPDVSRWDELAILLLERSRSDDDALKGLLTRSGSLPSIVIEREWATFLADAYRRSTLRTLETMSRLNLRQRRHVATLIVSAAVTLYGGELDDPAAPWPSRRFPEQMLSARAERAWQALLAAERDHRESTIATVADI